MKELITIATGQKHKDKTIISNRAYMFVLLLLESLDELEHESFYVKKMKQTGNKFKAELDRFFNVTFNHIEDKERVAEYITEMTKRIDKLIEEVQNLEQ